MQQVDEILPPSSINLNGSILKSEVVDQLLLASTELSVAPSSVTHAQLITIPMASNQSLLTIAPSGTIKRRFRTSLNNKKLNRSSGKPATLFARQSIGKAATILPHPQKPVILNNQITPINPAIQTNPPNQLTTYLVVDGNQGQLVQVANDGPKPVTFRNQAGQILQATPITVVSSANQPVPPINGDCSLLSNSSQTVTTVRTSSSIDMQQQTTLTSDTTTMTTQQLTGIMHQPPILQSKPTTILNGNNLLTYTNGSLLDEPKTSNINLSLSLAQIARKANHRHRRSSSSSLSKKKRGRPRLYERDPFTNKPIKSGLTPDNTELTIPNVTSSTLLMPGQTTTYNTLPIHSNGYSSFIFPNQTTTIPVNNPSLLQQHQYSYPSLLNGNTLSTNMIVTPTFNNFANNTNTTTSSSVTFPYSSQSTTGFSHPSLLPPTHTFDSQSTIPLKSLQISSTSTTPMTSSPRSTNVPSTIQINSSPIQAVNNDIAVHYIGGFVIRESSHPFLPNDNLNRTEKENNSGNDDQLQCTLCKTIDQSHRFFDKEKKFCSQICSFTSNDRITSYDRTPIINEPIRVTIPQQPVESNIDEQIPLPPDHGLPIDPNKWTVSQVGEFVARLTNETIRNAFYESEMDGQALLLMTQEHLRDTMKIKLGPSLIISSEIAKLRERAKTLPS